MAEEATEPTYNVGDSVWYCNQSKARVASVEEADEEGEGHYYHIVKEGNGMELTAHSDELSTRRTRINEMVRDKFGGLKVEVHSGHGEHAYVNYSIPAQGTGAELTAEEARTVAQAFRDGEEGLALIIDDDPHEVAQAFEEAADLLEDFEEQLEDPDA